MKTITKFICWATLAVGVTTACTDEDYLLYNTNQKDSVFFEYLNEKDEIATSVFYAFNYDIANSHTIEIPVTLMGMPSDNDRQIALNPVEEESTMVEGKHYEIESSVLPANSINTVVKIKLLRDKDPELVKDTFKITFDLVENQDLRGVVGSSRFSISYTDVRPQGKPKWVQIYDPLPDPSKFENMQLFFKYFYEKAPKADKDIFNEMIDVYGDYFMRATENKPPLTVYRTFMLNYVLIPLYNDYPDLKWQQIPQL